ncbi:hypothetical protein CMO92_00785 [Candidatus Woesearchaeota archaeon]|nr:hypothetical protein [Candidatus Woesearchaeota archaeon]
MGIFLITDGVILMKEQDTFEVEIERSLTRLVQVRNSVGDNTVWSEKTTYFLREEDFDAIEASRNGNGCVHIECPALAVQQAAEGDYSNPTKKGTYVAIAKKGVLSGEIYMLKDGTSNIQALTLNPRRQGRTLIAASPKALDEEIDKEIRHFVENPQSTTYSPKQVW